MLIFGVLAPENAIPAHSTTGLIKPMVLDILVMRLDISAKTTLFLM
jgi:hypothetical protein